MPSERISKAFKDISLSFQVNPLNYDLIAIKNETAIARSIRNLVLTQPGERFFNQNLGSKVNQSLFENIDDISASILRDEIRNTIENYEPRIQLDNVKVYLREDSNSLEISIYYHIVNTTTIQQFDLILKRTR